MKEHISDIKSVYLGMLSLAYIELYRDFSFERCNRSVRNLTFKYILDTLIHSFTYILYNEFKRARSRHVERDDSMNPVLLQLRYTSIIMFYDSLHQLSIVFVTCKMNNTYSQMKQNSQPSPYEEKMKNTNTKRYKAVRSLGICVNNMIFTVINCDRSSHFGLDYLTSRLTKERQKRFLFVQYVNECEYKREEALRKCVPSYIEAFRFEA